MSPRENSDAVDSRLLAVRDLRVSYRLRTGRISPAIADINFTLDAGEILGVLGESGSGKSTLAAALPRLLPANGKIESGAIFLEGRNLLQLDAREMEKIRGARMSAIFQEPSLALHPALRVGRQIGDVLAAHGDYSRGARREKTMELLSSVFAEDAERIARAYPHQLSGGQRQRVLVAQAIACSPALVIADEPTAALDASTQREMVSLFRELKQSLNVAMIFITHNPALLEEFADRIMVLYAGRIAEIGPAKSILESPLHPYTQALLRCLPPPFEMARGRHREELPVIRGELPKSGGLANGCCFEPRCEERMELCARSSPVTTRVRERTVSCFRYEGDWN